ncbi:MAG: cytochrome P450 [Spirochaetaceae bacterium]|nr:cytochrome P450 [Myxococcales bacterium]MCA9607305.1 cytochrome P450 [Myxococcales bacterium]MCB9726184.1 cytochrome P450 [Spirochaetaceae bacterium]HPG24605.1 cytochrome P450 [Myxococcota bacterium]
MTETTLDLFDHRVTQGLGETLASWRRESPVVRVRDVAGDASRVYVARMADCWRVLRDPVTFANGNGFKTVEMPDEERMLGEMDPPRHPRMRRILRRSFDKRAVEAERDFARNAAHELLDGFATGDRVDLVSRFSDRISNLSSFHLVGFPLEDTDRIIAWSRELLHSEWPERNRTERGQGLAGAFPEFAHYLDSLVASHRGGADPRSFVARFARAEIDGVPLSPTVLRTLTAHVVLGGLSTTTNLIGSLLYRLLRDPALHARLRAEPDLAPSLVEEVLRLDPPVLFVMRVCRRSTEIGSVPIAEGDSVLVGIASANRDEAVFEAPDELRLDRGLPRHISFSGGAHHCIGAGLARLVAQESVRAFVSHFDVGDVRLAADFEYQGVPVFLEHGPVRLPVDIVRRAGDA